jgi:bacillolysin
VRRSHRIVAATTTALVVLIGASSATNGLTQGDHPGSNGSAAPFVMATTSTVPVPGPTGGPQTTPAPSPAEQQQAQDVTPLSPIDAITELRQAETPAVLDIDRSNHIRSVSAAADAPLPPVPGAPETTDPVLVSASFVNRYGQGLGLAAGQQATVTRVDRLPGGDRVVRLRQQIGGLPVIGGDLIVAVNPAGQVVSASAETPVGTPATTGLAITANDAGARAVTAAAADLGVPADGLTAISSSAGLFDPRMLGAPGRPELRSTWWVKVGAAGRSGDLASVFIDATDGSAVLVLSERQTAKQRLICDLAGAVVDLDDFHTYDCSDAAGGPAVARREGQGPSGVTDVNAAYDNLGAVYDFYLNNFGRDSIDGYGMPLAATVRVCSSTDGCPYENAFWDGVQMVFGEGFAVADDVVGHELTHGLTSHTSELFYYAESGGINEALSDIMGELIDQSRGGDDDSQWLLGEDLSFGAIRSMKTPSMFGDPEQVGDANWNSAVNSSFDRFGVHSLSGVVNKTAYLLAAGGSGVSAIGNDKSAQIWYRLESLLPSGAEMADVAALLPAACRSIIGLHGITAGDCLQAAAATVATNLGARPTEYDDSTECSSAGMPIQTVFSEDFERGFNRWSLDPNWFELPSADIQVSWANSGKNALLVDRESTDNASDLAATHISFTTPSDGNPLFLSWAENVTTFAGGGGTVKVGATLGSAITTSGSGSFTRGGYVRRVTPLGVVPAGQSWSIFLQPFITGQFNEWLVDDLHLYQCLSTVNGAPAYVAGQLTGGGTSAQITWAAPQYLAPGHPPATYEVSVTPALTGFPNPIVVSAATLSTTLTNLDPSLRYAVSVRAVDAAGTPGPGVIAYLPGDGVFTCQPPSSGPRTHPLCPGTPQLPPLAN